MEDREPSLRENAGHVAYEAWRAQRSPLPLPWKQLSDPRKEQWMQVGESVCNFYQRKIDDDTANAMLKMDETLNAMLEKWERK